MTENATASFCRGPVNCTDVVAATESDVYGGRAFFFGAVREENLGRRVTAIHYDLFAPLAEKTLLQIAREAAERVARPGQPPARVTVAHSYGELKVGDVSVGIGVATRHRAEAFEACRYVIEELKKRAPIWKKEFYSDGETQWVQGHALCQHGPDGDGHPSGGGCLHPHGA